MIDSKQIRALVIGAHPDDCEYWTAGLATKYRAAGHAVKYVSMTSGNAGHHTMDARALADRRRAETEAVSALSGVEYEVLDIDDGRLSTDIPTRERLIRLIRKYRPDLIFTHRPNDYHPDHRATGTLVMDASYLMAVPLICPDTPHLLHRPVILYMNDHFQKPIPLMPDVAVAVDDVLDTKAAMLHCHESQFYEWLPYIGLYEDKMPTDKSKRLAWTRERCAERDTGLADKYRAQIVARYGEDEGRKVRRVEVFEVSEYGRSLPPAEVDDWFPR